ncbi:stress response protein SCP2 [Kineococcus radiotolerans]|uniref:Stress response protein SCP2 n=1 Tax=Kineococcus radiotolerans TaxID=131568 RepID=A0A7W4TRB8_KINRA|nr:AAA family ATPase [Kineococcus radiotolerans]MBB2903577.1 stress response protein SCP2 [Kineococcus radiotolerans]
MALMLDASGRVALDEDFVFYNNLASRDGSVLLTPVSNSAADAMLDVASDAAGDVAYLDIDLDAVHPSVAAIELAVSTDSATVGAYAGSVITITQRDQPPLERTIPSASSAVVAFLRLARGGDGWQFRIKNTPYDDLAAFAREHGVAVDDDPADDPADNSADDPADDSADDAADDLAGDSAGRPAGNPGEAATWDPERSRYGASVGSANRSGSMGGSADTAGSAGTGSEVYAPAGELAGSAGAVGAVGSAPPAASTVAVSYAIPGVASGVVSGVVANAVGSSVPAAPLLAGAKASPRIEVTGEFATALRLLEGGGNVFLTGKAGTGKSTLVRHFTSSTDRRVVVAAPTGIAALNVGGYTLHRLFGFRPATTLDDVESGDYRPGKFAPVLKAIDTLIIDEASMVRADLFDMVVTALERFGPRPGTLCGGVQIVLVGDLLQLPPVVVPREQALLEEHYETPYFFSAHRFSRKAFPTVALTHVFRQAGDQRFTSILNAVREGVLLDEVRDELNTRVVEDFEPPEGEFWLTLTPTNRIATARNRVQLEKLPHPQLEQRAVTSGDVSSFDSPVPEVLHFKVGAQVMMLTNDPQGRWVNGTLGIVTEADTADDEPVVSVVFDDGNVAEVGPFTWEVTRPVLIGGRVRRETVGTYRQLPFTLAWAITIHKSQGQTVDRLIVDLAGGAFDHGQTYVALSRCTTLQGLVLRRPLRPKDLTTDRRVLRFLRQATTTGQDLRLCAVAVLTVGADSPRSLPRPVEIAVAFEDGSGLSTLLNPQRDLGSAREDYAITVDDVLLAPDLAGAWPLIARLVDGCTPVGVGIDTTLDLLDAELRRLGVAVPLPLGIEVSDNDLTAHEARSATAPRALERAQAWLQAAHRRKSTTVGLAARRTPETSAWMPTEMLPGMPAEPSTGASPMAAGAGAGAGAAGVAGGVGRAAVTDPTSAFEADPFQITDLPGATSHLLTRDLDVATPVTARGPVLTDLLSVSRAVSAVVLQGAVAAQLPADLRREAHDPTVLAAVRVQLAAALAELGALPPRLTGRLREVKVLLGGHVVSVSSCDEGSPGREGVQGTEGDQGGGAGSAGRARPPIAEVLVSGARVCFTGSFLGSTGVGVSKKELEDLVTSHGLRWASNVSRTRCEALVVAEAGTQSGKARLARELGKPVFTAEDFFGWLQRPDR